MPRFKITSVSVVEAETAHKAMGDWREYPVDDVTEVTIVEMAALDKPEQPKTMAQKAVAATTALAKDAAAQAGVIEKTRICPDHQVAMQKKASKFGAGKFYFACPVKLDDGKYCKAKPL